jgi:hypothetical protein
MYAVRNDVRGPYVQKSVGADRQLGPLTSFVWFRGLFLSTFLSSR